MHLAGAIRQQTSGRVMSEYEALLKPLALKHLTLRNRIASTGHAAA
jgi:hypothetical protein